MTTSKTVFLTGATGNMGQEGLKQLLDRNDGTHVVALVPPTDRDRRIMSAWKGEPRLTIVWGDLTRYEDVLRCVSGADYVLHVGGMVSPAADRDPELTARVNVGSVRNIIRAIKAQPNADRIRLVFIGTVAETGDRNPPMHWGRAGDPIKISVFDHYAISKTIAEREVIESGLNYWVSLRQTGIVHGNRFNTGALLDPIMFHVPLNGVFEWVTARDSGRLLANVCEDGIPDHFWRRIYNIGGGEKCRITNYELLVIAFRAFGLGVGHLQALLDPKWFVLRNFHGHWYEDSDVLESYLHFRGDTADDFAGCLRTRAVVPPWLAGLTPVFVFRILRKLVLEPLADRDPGTQYWIRHDVEDRIRAFFGSKSRWERIPGWEGVDTSRPTDRPLRLNHGYDETKPLAELDVEDMRGAAEFRGGECVSGSMIRGDMRSQLQWRCTFGHEFAASPTLVLLAGQWCPQCLPPPWNYDAIAARNPFFAQVWPGVTSTE